MVNGQPAMPAMMQLSPAQGYGGQQAQQPAQPQYVQPGGPGYEVVVQQTPAYNTTVYVGNLVPYITQNDLAPLFQSFGYIVDIRLQADRGFAFLKLDTHENAAMAIVSLQGTPVQGRAIKCSWGKDSQGAAAAASAATQPVHAQPSPYANLDFSSSPYGPPDAAAIQYVRCPALAYLQKLTFVRVGATMGKRRSQPDRPVRDILPTAAGKLASDFTKLSDDLRRPNTTLLCNKGSKRSEDSVHGAPFLRALRGD
jgi:RNA recognition motif-containing protein